MRTLLKIVLFLAGTLLLILVVGFCWLYFYSYDLPDISTLAQFAPESTLRFSDPCLGSTRAIPYDAIGANLRNVISTIETSEDGPGVLKTALLGLTGHNTVRRSVNASRHIALWLCYSTCYASTKQFPSALTEFRTAVQLERRYSRKQLFTMFANRVPFGRDVVGIQSGSELFFHKSPAELNLAEATTLVMLMRMHSMEKHPDRALRLRNDFLDAMVREGKITIAQAELAKGAPLSVASDASNTR